MTSREPRTVTRLLAAYISLWNERNPRTRLAIATEIFTSNVSYLDPNTSTQGRSTIDTYVAGWQNQFPDFVFVLGDVHSHHNVAHFGWSFGPPGAPPEASGWDVVVIEQDRISSVYGFFN